LVDNDKIVARSIHLPERHTVQSRSPEVLMVIAGATSAGNLTAGAVR
jgi:hypothetical protein